MIENTTYADPTPQHPIQCDVVSKNSFRFGSMLLSPRNRFGSEKNTALFFLWIAAILIVAAMMRPALADPVDDALQAGREGKLRTEFLMFQALAEQGNAFAQYMVGLSYHNGEAVTRDFDKSIRWYRLAIDQGEPNAEYDVALMYESGLGLSKDHAMAAKLYKMAADQGHTSAQTNLGTLYATGDGVAQDYVQAYFWFSLAAEAGVDVAKANRDAQAKLMTKEQIAEAVRLVRLWKPTPPSTPKP